MSSITRRDQIVLAAGLLMVVYAFATIERRWAVDPRQLSQIAGRQLLFLEKTNADTLHLTGKARVLYLFDTRCPHCESQRAQMASLLGALPKDAVISASIEDDSLIRSYWADLKVDLPAPVALKGGQLDSLDFNAVPGLIFLQPNGVIHSAYIGRILDWTRRIMHDHYNAAASSMK